LGDSLLPEAIRPSTEGYITLSMSATEFIRS